MKPFAKAAVVLVFLLNSGFTIANEVVFKSVSSNRILVSGLESTGPARGPAFQLFDQAGNLLLTKFVLNTNFSNIQAFEAETSGVFLGQEIVVGGIERTGLARGPAFQIFDSAGGSLLLTRFVLNPDFTEVTFTAVDLDNDGLNEILVVGRETSGLQRGPAFQLFTANGNLVLTRFVLNNNFTNLSVFITDHNGDGDDEIGIGGVESTGSHRGPAYQIFDFSGNLLLTKFVLNANF